MSPRLVADLAAALADPAEGVEATVRSLLGGQPHAPPLGDLLELGARARRRAAPPEELGLAVATLLAFHAPPAGRVSLDG